jgi:hypothetical protein
VPGQQIQPTNLTSLFGQLISTVQKLLPFSETLLTFWRNSSETSIAADPSNRAVLPARIASFYIAPWKWKEAE